ncbi:hypothetical protein PRN20_06100 [Devosia sp. ZB163]|uniref:hypothetical protein n=1 Tax=Devosia sp. ZB163 TaxID=3025938 RepID=UPI00235F3D79|nr:hypothetical protein [Devosia sp. ZB163]MDC9823296.1 hypothetical protein [Devosia sp. ZB163]
MDSDLTKHVIVSRLGQEITVQVRYASDVVLEEDVHRFRTNGPVEIVGRQLGNDRLRDGSALRSLPMAAASSVLVCAAVAPA